MKKTKILMPILASAGVVATIAPITCLTSCALTKFTKEMQEDSKNKGEFGTGTQNKRLKNNADIELTATVKEQCTATKIQFSIIESEGFSGGGEYVPYYIIDSENVTILSSNLQYNSAEKSYFDNFGGSTPFGFFEGYKILISFRTEQAINAGWQCWLKLHLQ